MSLYTYSAELKDLIETYNIQPSLQFKPVPLL